MCLFGFCTVISCQQSGCAMPFSNVEKRDMLKLYSISRENATAARQNYQEEFPDRVTPGRKVFKKLFDNLGQYGSFVKPRIRRRTVVTEEFEEVVLAYFVAHPRSSIRIAASVLNASRKSVETVLKRHKYHPYKPNRLQALHPGDEDRRMVYCAWLAEQAVEDDNFLGNVIWTDESNFSNRGMSNRHNTHYWSRQNPLLVLEGQDQVRFSINCWCAMKNNRILAVHFYEGNLNGDRYRGILENVLLNAIEDLPLNRRMNVIYQHDGAPAHNSDQVVQFLNTHFPNQWMGTHGPILWPARSPDLTPLDFFLWGYLKDKLYEERCVSVEEMVRRIRNILREVHHNTLRKAVNQCLERAHACMFNSGSHFEHQM